MPKRIRVDIFNDDISDLKKKWKNFHKEENIKVFSGECDLDSKCEIHSLETTEDHQTIPKWIEIETLLQETTLCIPKAKIPKLIRSFFKLHPSQTILAGGFVKGLLHNYRFDQRVYCIYTSISNFIPVDPQTAIRLFLEIFLKNKRFRINSYTRYSRVTEPFKYHRYIDYLEVGENKVKYVFDIDILSTKERLIIVCMEPYPSASRNIIDEIFFGHSVVNNFKLDCMRSFISYSKKKKSFQFINTKVGFNGYKSTREHYQLYKSILPVTFKVQSLKDLCRQALIINLKRPVIECLMLDL